VENSKNRVSRNIRISISAGVLPKHGNEGADSVAIKDQVEQRAGRTPVRQRRRHEIYGASVLDDLVKASSLLSYHMIMTYELTFIDR